MKVADAVELCKRVYRVALDEDGKPIPGVKRVYYCGHANVCGICAERRSNETRARILPKVLEVEKEAAASGREGSWGHYVFTLMAAQCSDDLRPLAKMGWLAIKEVFEKIDRFYDREKEVRHRACGGSGEIRETAENGWVTRRECGGCRGRGYRLGGYRRRGISIVSSVEMGHGRSSIAPGDGNGYNVHFHVLMKTAGTALELDRSREPCERCEGTGKEKGSKRACRRCDGLREEKPTIAIAQQLIPLWRRALKRAQHEDLDGRPIRDWLSPEWHEALRQAHRKCKGEGCKRCEGSGRRPNGGVRGARSTEDPCARCKGIGSGCTYCAGSGRQPLDALLKEVLKYLCKGVARDDDNSASLAFDAYTAWQSMRRVRTYGEIYGLKIEEAGDDPGSFDDELDPGAGEPVAAFAWSNPRWRGSEEVDWREKVWQARHMIRLGDDLADESAFRRALVSDEGN